MESKEKLEKLAAYADNPVALTCLVLVHRNKMPDKRLSAVKRIQKAGVVFQSDRIRDYKLPEWIERHLSSQKAPHSARAPPRSWPNTWAMTSRKWRVSWRKLFIALARRGRGERCAD